MFASGITITNYFGDVITLYNVVFFFFFFFFFIYDTEPSTMGETISRNCRKPEGGFGGWIATVNAI